MYVKHRWLKNNMIQKREYQESIVKTALKGNTLCVLPTGLGKTAIAAMVAAERVDIGKVLFLAPTKPLVEQHKKTFEKFFKLGLEFDIATGKVQRKKRELIYKKADVIFSTPQTIKNDLLKNIISLKDFSLLIVDEAHRCVKKYAYTFVAKKYIEQALNPLILALTASPGSDMRRVKEIKEKLFITFAEIRTHKDRDVEPYVKRINIEYKMVELNDAILNIKSYLEISLRKRIDRLIKLNVINKTMITRQEIIKLQDEYASSNSEIKYFVLKELAEILKLDHALLTLETQCLYTLSQYFKRLQLQDKKSTKQLLKDDNFIKAVKLTSLLIKKHIEHPKIEKIVDIMENLKNKKVIIFAQYKDTVQAILYALSNVRHCKPIALFGQRHGLKQKEQVNILNEFELGIYNTLVTTSIGEEGLHLGSADVAIFYEPIPSAIRVIQRRGRVGREKEGKVIILITKGTRDEAYYWSAYHKERRMRRLVKSMQYQMSGLKKFF